jgi:NADH dehydrogenase (ubiquinone) 1 alpha subcomplex subunit 2
MAAAATKALRFGPGLKEVRLHLCQKSAASAGVREFVEKHYVALKVANPTFPILVRECGGILPRAWGRLGYGREVGTGGRGKAPLRLASTSRARLRTRCTLPLPA